MLRRLCTFLVPSDADDGVGDANADGGDGSLWAAAQLDGGATLRLLRAHAGGGGGGRGGGVAASWDVDVSATPGLVSSAPLLATVRVGEAPSCAHVAPDGSLLVGTTGGRVIVAPRAAAAAHAVDLVPAAVRQLEVAGGETWALVGDVLVSAPGGPPAPAAEFLKWRAAGVRAPQRFCLLRPASVPLLSGDWPAGGDADAHVAVAGAAPAVATFRARRAGGPASLGDLAVAAWRGLEGALPPTVSAGVKRLYALGAGGVVGGLLRLGAAPAAAAAGAAVAAPSPGLAALQGAPAKAMEPCFDFLDEPRRVTAMVADPSGTRVLLADGGGRVLLVDAADVLVVRMWKGYRGAQLGWAVAAAGPAAGPLAARRRLVVVIYAPRRRQVELWPAAAGPRVAAVRVDVGGGGGGGAPAAGDDDDAAARLLYAPPPPAPSGGDAGGEGRAPREPRVFLLRRDAAALGMRGSPAPAADGASAFAAFPRAYVLDEVCAP